MHPVSVISSIPLAYPRGGRLSTGQKGAMTPIPPWPGGRRAASSELSRLTEKAPNFQQDTEKVEWRRVPGGHRVARTALNSGKSAE